MGVLYFGVFGMLLFYMLGVGVVVCWFGCVLCCEVDCCLCCWLVGVGGLVGWLVLVGLVDLRCFVWFGCMICVW